MTTRLTYKNFTSKDDGMEKDFTHPEHQTLSESKLDYE